MHETLGGLLARLAAAAPEREFMVYPDRNLRFTYREFDDRVSLLAKGLLAIGLKKGDHLGIWATNVPDWLTFMFATARIGVVLVTVNTNYRSHELAYVLKQSAMTTLALIDGCKDVDYVATVKELIPELGTQQRGYLNAPEYPQLKNVIFIGPQKHRGMFTVAELLLLGAHCPDAELAAAAAACDPHDVINMQYTSGTTGFPKGVMLTHYNIMNNGLAIGDRQKFTGADRICLPVPLFHCFGCVLGVMAMITHHATLVMLESFDPLLVLAAIQRERATAVYGVPTMFIMELNHPMFRMFDLSSLRTGIMAGSPCPIEVMKQVISDMHCTDITICYGLTEASPVITQTSTDDPIEKRVGTVGTPLPGIEVKLIDPETGAPVTPGTPGELCCRGYNVMKGYFNLPEATAQAIEPDGWLHSGDLATLDPDGYYVITGRWKDMIIRGGENVYPREIEEFLYQMPGVKDVQVVGVPDAKYGEQVAAFIIPHAGKSVSPEEVKDFCRGKISRYKIPAYTFSVDSYPLTASGKIQKFKLREQATALVAALNESGS